MATSGKALDLSCKPHFLSSGTVKIWLNSSDWLKSIQYNGVRSHCFIVQYWNLFSTVWQHTMGNVPWILGTKIWSRSWSKLAPRLRTYFEPELKLWLFDFSYIIMWFSYRRHGIKYVHVRTSYRPTTVVHSQTQQPVVRWTINAIVTSAEIRSGWCQEVMRESRFVNV